MSSLSAAEMTPSGFATIALLMSICIMWGMVLSIFFNKRYLGRLGSGKKSSGGAGFGDTAMTAMFIGLVSAYIGSYIGGFVSGGGLFSFSGSFMPLIVVFVSGLVMAGFIYLSEKKKSRMGRKLLDRRKHAYRHGSGGRGQAVYVRRRTMNNNYFESYNKRTHVIGRISSAIALVMLVGAPFLIGRMLGAMPDIGAVGKAFLSVGLVWTVSSVVEFLVYTRCSAQAAAILPS